MFASPRFRHGLALLALILIALLMLRANPLNDTTIAPFDLLVAQPGWKQVENKPPLVHIQHSDILDSKLPAWIYLKKALRAGHLPLWNPLTASGAPGIQLLTRSGMTPAFAAFALFDDDATGLYAAALVNLLIIGFGAYFLFFFLSGNRIAAILGAFVLSYSGFIAGWFYWPHVNTAIWLPWVLLFGLRYMESGCRRDLPWFSLTSVFLILGGFPIVAVYTYLALGLGVLIRLSSLPVDRRTRLARIGELSLFAILAALMTGFAVLSLAEYLHYAGISHRHGGSALTRLSDLRLFILPFSDHALFVERSVYVGLFPVVAFFVALWLVLRRRADWRIIWGLSLIAVSVVFAFMLLPRAWLSEVPLIGSNPWSRMILLIDLGLAILAVSFYQRIWRWAAGRLPPLGFLALVVTIPLLQGYDQGRVFMRRVAPVDDGLVFPRTATLAYLRTHLSPLQNVIADKSFMTAGVLGAYGMPEWFAHEMRPESDKRALDGWLIHDPFVTSTASAFRCGQIRFDGRGLDYFGVRYLVCGDDRGAIDQRVFSSVDYAEADWSAPLSAEGLVQHFHIDADFALYRFEIQAHPDSPPATQSSLEIRDSGGNTFGKTDCRITEDHMLACVFPHTLRLRAGDVRLIIRPANHGLRLGIAHFDHQGILIEQGGLRQAAVLRMNVYRRFENKLDVAEVLAADAGRRFATRHLEPGIDLYENKHVRAGAYVIHPEDRTPMPDYTQVSLLDATPGHLVFDYRGERPAWVVVPMRFYPGWRARVNGEPVRLSRFLGMLPAARVDGPARVTLDFTPTGFPATLVMSLLAFLVWLLSAWRFSREPCGREPEHSA